jgi:hypothetical protein
MTFLFLLFFKKVKKSEKSKKKDSRQPAGKLVTDETQDPYKQPGWLEEIKEQITRLPTSKGHNALGATSQT